MTISGTQATAALPATTSTAAARPSTNITAAQAAAAPAIGGVHGAKHMPPLFDPFDRIQSLLRDLLLAVQQLRSPVGPYPPFDRPPFEPPFMPYEPMHPGCPHMWDMPPIEPLPPQPPVIRKRVEVGDVIGGMFGGKGGNVSDIKVRSVHGSYQDRAKAVAAAKHLSGISGDALFGVAVSHGVNGQARYSVVGLSSQVPLSPRDMGSTFAQYDGGWSLDTIAFSATTARRVDQGFATPMPMDAPTAPGQAAPAPVPAPAPSPHSH